MSWMKWLPWRFVIRRIARAQGFLDPIALLARLHSFAQPSEVGEPIELLRAGVVFHARGLINSRVIQHNLDWVWPYWIERQFDPRDPSFVPRAFSITHINLTHRNWTAIGHPDCEELPIVDPRGLLTPVPGRLVTGRLAAGRGRPLPAALAGRRLPATAGHGSGGLHRHRDADAGTGAGEQRLGRARIRPAGMQAAVARAQRHGCLAGAGAAPLQPGGHQLHPPGQPVERPHGLDGRRHAARRRSAPPPRGTMSPTTATGTCTFISRIWTIRPAGRCDVGMVTAAALFPVKANEAAEITATIPLAATASAMLAADAWNTAQRNRCNLVCPEPRYQFLYDAAITSLILHSPDDVYPGPYTYKRFWFRDAAFIIHALLCAGLTERAERALARFPERQTALGYFRSQEGEWDANGEVLWILQRFFALTGQRAVAANGASPIQRGARWIMRKRLSRRRWMRPMPACCRPGFSAEHLGPNDYYYWDDFWGIAGLRRGIGHARGAGCRGEQGIRAGRRRFRGRGGSQPRLAARNGSGDRRCPHRPIAAWMPAPSVRSPSAIRCSCVRRTIRACSTASSSCSSRCFVEWRVLPGHDPFRPQRVPDPARRAGAAARRRPAPPRADGCGRGTRIADRAVAGGDPSAHRRRLHGRRPSRLGRRRVGADDPQLLRARGRRTPRSCARAFPRAGSSRTRRSASALRRPPSARCR